LVPGTLGIVEVGNDQDTPCRRYEVRISGRLSESLIDELTAAEIIDTTTGIVVEVSDEAALNGLLRRLETLGLELISIQRTD
jgi:hypothetical protein